MLIIRDSKFNDLELFKSLRSYPYLSFQSSFEMVCKHFEHATDNQIIDIIVSQSYNPNDYHLFLTNLSSSPYNGNGSYKNVLYFIDKRYSLQQINLAIEKCKKVKNFI